MSKDLVETGGNAVAVATMDSWGQEQEISTRDIMISKILPMQGMSKMVTERKAQIGEYRDSVTGELLGTIDESMEFIPFHVEKLWIVQKEVNGKMEYQGMEPITRENEDRQWEMVIEGIKHRYDWNYLYYVLLPKDVAAGTPTPYIVSFRRTSVRGGKKLFTQMFVRNRQMGKTPASMVINLEGRQQSNDKGTFIVLDISVGRETKEDELKAAFELYKLVQAGSAKVDHSDVVMPVHNKKYASDNTEF